ncbi:MAG: CDP-alcohol phosphatidyltransferase family protein [Gammaproteobacteria bacterium]|nr:CDP-alcohol phosphatidyltransferase family protein [Gammaproteobacteria bacterium]
MKQTLLRYLPNIITGMRLLAILPVAFCLWVEEYACAFVLFAFAGVSDGVDGYLARRFNWKSHWGAVMDPLADKLLLVTTAAILVFKSLLPLWLFIIMMGRDLMIVSGAAFYRWRFGPYEVTPSLFGKASTFFQILLVLSLLIHAAFGLMSEFQLDAIVTMTAAITLISGAHYFYIWIRKAMYA